MELPDLCTGSDLANFHSAGILPDVRDLLHKTQVLTALFSVSVKKGIQNAVGAHGHFLAQ